MKTGRFLNPAQISCGVHHGRQQTQTLRTPTGLELKVPGLRDQTINGMIWPSLFPRTGRPLLLRESCGEELQATCTTAMISWPRYGSIVETSLLISQTLECGRLGSISPTKAIHVCGHLIPQRGKGRLQKSEANPNKNPDSVFPFREYVSGLRVMPSEHDNTTLGALRERCQAPPALLAVCVNSPAPGCSNRWHPHFF